MKTKIFTFSFVLFMFFSCNSVKDANPVKTGEYIHINGELEGCGGCGYDGWLIYFQDDGTASIKTYDIWDEKNTRNYSDYSFWCKQECKWSYDSQKKQLYLTELTKNKYHTVICKALEGTWQLKKTTRTIFRATE